MSSSKKLSILDNVASKYCIVAKLHIQLILQLDKILGENILPQTWRNY